MQLLCLLCVTPRQAIPICLLQDGKRLSKREHNRNQEAAEKKVHQRQRSADLHEVRERVPAGTPHQGVSLVANRRDKGRRGSNHHRQHERLVANLVKAMRDGGGGGIFS